jgi:magnesium-protoporphyrin O-methyltransferase
VDAERHDDHCCFDDWARSNARRARKRETVAAITGSLLTALEEAGLAGRSVLDLGCGVGDLALTTLAHGASRATGIDLGRGAIAEARGLAAERGLDDRATFTVGDASTFPLEPHDVVVLNRVICCYPHLEGLIRNSLEAARDVYAFTAPVARGPIGAFVRLQTRLANVWYALRRSRFGDFRVFVHDLDAVDRKVRAAGFRSIRRERRRLVWELGVYVKEEAAPLRSSVTEEASVFAPHTRTTTLSSGSGR